MRAKEAFFITLFILVSTISAFADISIKAEVDKTTITTDETLTYKLSITSTEKNIPQPQIPKFTGFNAISQAQSSSFSYSTSGPRSILIYAFVLTTTDIGKFKIEPSVIKIKDKTYYTDAFEIEVTHGKSEPKTPSKPELPLPKEPPSESGQPQFTL